MNLCAALVSGATVLARIGGREASALLKRHLAPRTVGALLRALPLEGNVHGMEGAVYVGTPVAGALEKPRREFARGDVAFSPPGGMVCFFLREASPGRPMVLVGRVESGIELLDSARPGDAVRLEAQAGL